MIAILQPLIPHYREEFFDELAEKYDMDVYTYDNSAEKNNFQLAKFNTLKLATIKIKKFLLYSPVVLLNNKYDTLVLMANIGHLTTYFLLLTKFLHKKKIIIWGHGISVQRYHIEEKKPDLLLKLMFRLADIVWVYTSKEQDLWKQIFPQKIIYSLNNTISNIDVIVNYVSQKSKEQLRSDYGITQVIVFIYCARFNSPSRRTDILEKVINDLDSVKYGFIIIGDGQFKPDFSVYSNVYDFGAVYDQQVKNDLFMLSDIYFQPASLGLSLVEALAYGKPVVTLKRSNDIYQGVEYSYLINNYNSILVNTSDDLKHSIELLNQDEIERMSINSKDYAKENLSIKHMISNAKFN